MPGARPVAYTDPELNLLTEREREVLVEIAHGLSNQEIADKLFISLPTAKTHVAHILAKINARDRVQAVVLRLTTTVWYKANIKNAPAGGGAPWHQTMPDDSASAGASLFAQIFFNAAATPASRPGFLSKLTPSAAFDCPSTA